MGVLEEEKAAHDDRWIGRITCFSRADMSVLWQVLRAKLDNKTQRQRYRDVSRYGLLADAKLSYFSYLFFLGVGRKIEADQALTEGSHISAHPPSSAAPHH